MERNPNEGKEKSSESVHLSFNTLPAPTIQLYILFEFKLCLVLVSAVLSDRRHTAMDISPSRLTGRYGPVGLLILRAWNLDLSSWSNEVELRKEIQWGGVASSDLAGLIVHVMTRVPAPLLEFWLVHRGRGYGVTLNNKYKMASLGTRVQAFDSNHNHRKFPSLQFSIPAHTQKKKKTSRLINQHHHHGWNSQQWRDLLGLDSGNRCYSWCVSISRIAL